MAIVFLVKQSSERRGGAQLRQLPAGLRAGKDSPWIVELPLKPCCATGPGATPGAIIPFDQEPGFFSEDGLRHEFQDFMLGDGKTTRSAASNHCGHAWRLAEHLHYCARAPVSAVTEYDLRMFLFESFPRIAHSANEIARMPGSLRRFFAFLSECKGIHCPWAAAVLDDRKTYMQRARSYKEILKADKGRPDVSAVDADGWEYEYLPYEWLRSIGADLFLRELEMAPSTAVGLLDAETSDQLWLLNRQLQRLWLMWRDELIADGYSLPGPLHKALVARQLIWENEVHEFFGRTPVSMAGMACHSGEACPGR